MQRLIIYLLFCFAFNNAAGQQMIQKKIFSNSTYDAPFKIIQLHNSDFIFSNYTFTGSKDNSVDLIRLDSTLNMQWVKRIELYQPYRVGVAEFHEIADDTLIGWGTVDDSISSNNSRYLMLIKLTSNGNLISAKLITGEMGDIRKFRINGSEWSQEQQMLVLYGKYEETHFYDERMQILAFDKDLNFLWGKQYRYGFLDEIRSAKFYGNNGLIMQVDMNGEVDSSSTEPCCFPLLIRIDGNGNPIWTKRIGSIPNLYPAWGFVGPGEVLVLENGDLINTFITNYFVSSPYYDVVVQKTDSLGNELNAVRIGDHATQFDYFFQMLETKSGNLIVRLKLYFNFILDSNLNFVDIKRAITTYESSYVNHQIINKNGGSVVLGQFQNSKKISLMLLDSLSNVGCNQFPFMPYPYQQVSFPNSIAMKVLQDSSITVADSNVVFSITPITSYQDSLICYTATSVETFEKNNFKIFPTVFTEGVFIESDNPAQTSVELYDMLGRKIMYLSSAPEYLHLADLKQGMYFIRMKNKSHYSTFKIVKR